MQTFRLTPRVCRAACAAPSRTTFITHFPSDILSQFRIDNSTPAKRREFAFSPRFDVRETAGAYELQGELPGIRQDDVSIEFVDGTTLVVKGQAERESAALGAAGGEEEKLRGSESPATVTGSEKSVYHRATVEDEYVDAGAESEIEGGGEATPAATDAGADVGGVVAEEKSRDRYWISERRTGRFERRFKFAGQLDQEAVKASLRNGVLSIVVPKVERKERRILVE